MSAPPSAEGWSTLSGSEDDRLILPPPAWRRREKGIRTDDDLVDRRAVFALLHPNRLRAGRGEIDVRTRPPSRCQSNPNPEAPRPDPSCKTASSELVVPIRAVGEPLAVTEPLNWR